MFSDFPFVEILEFRGACSRRDATQVPPGLAISALNCEFDDGQVGHRKGFTSVWNVNQIVTGMYNWVKGADAISAAGSYLIYYTPTTSKVRYVPNTCYQPQLFFLGVTVYPAHEVLESTLVQIRLIERVFVLDEL